MESTSFMRVDEVAQELGISKSYAYKIVQKLNVELKEKGFMTISGRVNAMAARTSLCQLLIAGVPCQVYCHLPLEMSY